MKELPLGKTAEGKYRMIPIGEKMKKRIFIFLALSVLIFGGFRIPKCQAIEKRIIFGFEYFNGAKGHHDHGLYIDENGDVFENGNTWNGRTQQYEYLPEKKIDKIENDKLKEMVKLIEPASKGPYTPEEGVGADAVTMKFFCYEYDKVGKQQKILLIMKGDRFQANNSEAAKKLIDLLKIAFKNSQIPFEDSSWQSD